MAVRIQGGQILSIAPLIVHLNFVQYSCCILSCSYLPGDQILYDYLISNNVKHNEILSQQQQLQFINKSSLPASLFTSLWQQTDYLWVVGEARRLQMSSLAMRNNNANLSIIFWHFKDQTTNIIVSCSPNP